MYIHVSSECPVISHKFSLGDLTTKIDVLDSLHVVVAASVAPVWDWSWLMQSSWSFDLSNRQIVLEVQRIACLSRDLACMGTP
jgi:hypothetical protein